MEEVPLAVGQKRMREVGPNLSLLPHHSSLAPAHGSGHLKNVKFSVIEMRTGCNFVLPPISAIGNNRDCSTEESSRDAHRCNTHVGVFYARSVCIGNNYCINNNTKAIRVAWSIKNTEYAGNVTRLHKYGLFMNLLCRMISKKNAKFPI
jgi:hypothetical protein